VHGLNYKDLFKSTTTFSRQRSKADFAGSEDREPLPAHVMDLRIFSRGEMDKTTPRIYQPRLPSALMILGYEPAGEF
jgi:hypothetical protein